MKVSLLQALAASALLLASPACAGDKAASDPNSAAAPAAPAAGGTAAGDANFSPAAPALSSVPSAKPRDPNDAVAKVNGVPIFERHYQEAIKEFLVGQGAPANLPEDQMGQVRQAVMEALIGTELVWQKSQAEGVKVAPQEIDDAIAQSMKEFPTLQAWEDSLKQQGTTKDEFRESVGRNLAINKTIQSLVFEKITITDDAAKAYYDQHPQEMQQPEELQASHILLRVPEGATEEQKSAALSKAKEALAKLKAGGDFAALAKEYSQDPGSAANGGDLGFFGRGRMVPAFEKAAYSMKIGQVSDIVETQFGYHIIKVTGHHDAKTAAFPEISERLKGFLKQKQARSDVQTFLKELRDKAKVEIF